MYLAQWILVDVYLFNKSHPVVL